MAPEHRPPSPEQLLADVEAGIINDWTDAVSFEELGEILGVEQEALDEALNDELHIPSPLSADGGEG